MTRAEPTVSVVTPFFNTANYLSECIESVLGQSWRDFEYVLVDNQSTDGSGAIAAAFAERDPRIRLIRTPSFLSQVQNYNFALTQISATSLYCKVVQADDWLFPRCLEEMTTLATAHPELAIVSAYRLRGTSVLGSGLCPHREIISGREACRLFLIGNVFMFGSPTTLLYRADIVRQRRPFFEEHRLHEDTEVVFDILAEEAFGMLHQVLTFTRVHENSISGAAQDFSPDALDYLILVKRFGQRYLTPCEYDACLRGAERFYYASLAHGWLSRPTLAFLKYHTDGLATAGERLKPSRVVRHLGAALLGGVLPPVLRRRLRRNP